MNDKEMQQATEKIIIEMLTESTGEHPMDSGDAYGRHWEENQKEILQGEQPCDFCNVNDETELIPTVPIFDYLKRTMEYNEDCQELEELLPNLQLDALDYIEDVIQNPSNYDSKFEVFEKNTIFGSKVDNTYNYGATLSQDFQYIWFEAFGVDFIAISIHNGCDIRGGYTNIHIFEVRWAEETWMAIAEANIKCKCGLHHYRQMEGGYIEYNDDEREYDKEFVFDNSYVDENGQLRCKHCNELITCEMIHI